jgi:hypothetical protein
MHIQQTKDFTMFKKLEGNRPINTHHIKRLANSISIDNQLHLHPIIINKEYSVIDGQHRLEAAKMLGLDIYFIQSDTISAHHLIECNVNQKTFEVDNYIDFFAIKDKLPEYIELRRLLNQTDLKPKALLTLIFGTVNQSLLESIKTGSFSFTSSFEPEIIDFFNEFMFYVAEKRVKPYSMFTNHNFTKALRCIFKTTGFEKEMFFKKLDVRWFDLKPQRNANDWYTLLISIYNFKKHIKLTEEFRLEK